MRELEAVDARRRIGRAVAGVVQDGEAVALDSGTTAFSENSATRLLQPGGEVRLGELAAVGPLAVSTIASLRFDTAIVCPCGLADGTASRRRPSPNSRPPA